LCFYVLAAPIENTSTLVRVSRPRDDVALESVVGVSSTAGPATRPSFARSSAAVGDPRRRVVASSDQGIVMFCVAMLVLLYSRQEIVNQLDLNEELQNRNDYYSECMDDLYSNCLN